MEFLDDDFQVDEDDFESLINRAIENSCKVRCLLVQTGPDAVLGGAAVCKALSL